jgi:CubicO group peptidase (beta-lactamase class C family)
VSESISEQMAGEVTVSGDVAPGFEAVGDAFREALARSHGNGSALHIRQGGKAVVDLWGGRAGEGGERWQPDTPTVVFSCTKGLLAVLVGELVREGRLDLDAPVAEVWPEFGQKGKSDISVRSVLAHRAGLPTLRRDLELNEALDWVVMSEMLAQEEPLVVPDSGYVYHALTYGWLVGEVIRRVAGASVGEFFSSRIAAPLAADAWIGVPPSRISEVAHLFGADAAAAPDRDAGDDAEALRWLVKTMTLGNAFPEDLATPDGGFNRDDVRMAEVPGAGGVASARALATIWSATVTEREHVRLLDSAIIADMSREQSGGEPLWPIPGPWPRWGSGFMLSSERRLFLSPSSFGHDGAGGQVAFADPGHEIGFAYVTNDLQMADDDRGTDIVRALQASLFRN